MISQYITSRVMSCINLFRPSPILYSIENFRPKCPHQVIEDKFLDNFDEVFVIGDVHGCFDELSTLMGQIHNSTQIDRILKVFTGDLLNKGPKNKQVLDYVKMNQNSCISVRGNHDEVILKQYAKHLNSEKLKEKNEWVKDLTPDDVDYLAQLPFTLSIPKLNIVVVHAGLMPGVKLEDQKPFDMIEMRHLIKDEDGEYRCTKNDTEGIPWAQVWPGPYHVYFGHDAKKKLQEHPFATGLDTGVVYGFKLTGKFVMGPRTGQYASVDSLKCWKPLEPTKNPTP